MRRGLSYSDGKYCRQEDNNDQYSLGNLDLINLRLNVPSNHHRQHQEEQSRSNKFEKDSRDSFFSENRTHQQSSQNRVVRYGLPLYTNRTPQVYENKSTIQGSGKSEDAVLIYSKNGRKKIVKSEPINPDDFLYPSKKKVKARTIDFLDTVESSQKNNCSRPQTTDSRITFPFKLTPSGNLKVETSQVVFASKKLSVLVADPKNTKVNISSEQLSPRTEKMAHEHYTRTPCTPMENLINETGGLSSLGSLIGNSPVRSPTKEASEYESKQTNEILDPELNLNRLGYNGSDPISWEKVKLPEKHNLYLELYHRITNNTNADCKVYIDNEEFSCHLIVLQCYSELFDAYVAVKKVELPSDKCSVIAFSFIYDWMITGEPSYVNLNRENVLDIFISAKYLKIKDLVEQCWAFIDNVDVFNEDTAFLLYMDAKRRNLSEVKELMLPRIQLFFLMLVSSQDWLELEVDDIKNLLKSNYIAVNCEMEIFMSSVRWLKHDWENRDQFKYDVLECVRFGNIAPWQLVDIKRNPENPDFMELAKDIRICKMIDDGLAYVIIKYWYGQENEDFQHWNTVLGLQEPPARNWNGPDKTYFTFREFLIYLDQYRRNQLIEKNKPKSLEQTDNKSKENKFVSEKNSPRVPTMEEFMKKKKTTCQKKINKVMS